MTHFDYDIRLKSQRLADLKSQTAELERMLSDARASLDRELAQFASSREVPPAWSCPRGAGADPDGETAPVAGSFAGPGPEPGGAVPGDHLFPAADRTEILVNQGRRSAYSPRRSRRRIAAVAIASAVIAVLAIIAVTALSQRSASWPSSVLTVQREAARACHNPDVQSEPGQVNFACGKSTRQILWIFALMASSDNPDFADRQTGRLGLEPITPGQGDEVAWSLNLHHPYNPYNPVDSLAVAARAINNIIAGATVTGTDGKTVVQPGLEGVPANCARYTGSAAVIARQGFPSLCAKPVTSARGQAALVADVYQKWLAGSAPWIAADAAVLFENAHDPGNPRVQAILRRLLTAGPSA